MNHVTLLLDKSALQGLSPLGSGMSVPSFPRQFTPVFCGNDRGLAKQKPRTQSAEGDVIALSRKITSWSLHVNAGVPELMMSELQGNQFPLEGRIAEGRSEIVELEDGKRVMLVDSIPTQEMLDRWVKGDFSAAERGLSP